VDDDGLEEVPAVLSLLRRLANAWVRDWQGQGLEAEQ